MYTIDEDMTPDITRYTTNLKQWLTALKLLVQRWLMALKLLRGRLKALQFERLS